MKLGRFPAAAVVLSASLASVMAVAQTQSGGGLNIPGDVQFIGNQDSNVRTATAIVNGAVLTESDIDHGLALILAANPGIELPADEVQRLRAQVLRKLIDETLQMQAAEAEEITVEDREVDQYYAQIAQQSNQTAASFGAYLRTIGSSERAVKRQIKADLAWQRLQRRMIEPFVTVGDEEVQDVIDRLNASRGTREYRVAEIFISATPETAAEARANAARIVEQVRNGASFQAYARQFSEASTAALGGELGWVRTEQLPAELGALISEMPVGAISDPVAVPGGFSIVAVGDTRQILMADPRDAVLSLMQLSISMPEGTSREQAQARAQRLASATQSMGGCGRAPEVAQTLGAELVTNDQIRVRDIGQPMVEQMLLGLNVGQATPPFGSTERVSVLVLCGRDDPQQASGPSFDQVYSQMNDERVGRRAQRYLRDLRRDAIIDYR